MSEWDCPYCGAMNREDSLQCFYCSAPRRRSQITPPASLRINGCQFHVKTLDAILISAGTIAWNIDETFKRMVKE